MDKNCGFHYLSDLTPDEAKKIGINAATMIASLKTQIVREGLSEDESKEIIQNMLGSICIPYGFMNGGYTI